jgi:4-alpha-glucanotransferase
MNTTGTDVGNWSWRAAAGSFDAELAARLREEIAQLARGV